MKRAIGVAIWMLSAFLTLVMVGSGAEKFLKPAWERMFRVWGYPDHFYIVVGVVEIAAGVALLVPRIASGAAMSLAVVMIGAAYTQLTHHGSGVGELMLMTFCAVVAYARWPRRVRLKTQAPTKPIVSPAR